MPKVVYNPVHDSKLQLQTSNGDPIALIDTKANILATTPSEGIVAFATDTNKLYVADESDWYESADSPNSVSITRDGDLITSWTTDGVTFTPTYADGLMSSYTDGISTWAITRDGEGRIIGVTKS